MPKSALIIPCFNEQDRLNIKLFSEFLVKNISVDIHLIDDGSVDNTFKIIKKIEKKHTNCFAHRNITNLGKSNIIRMGIHKVIKEYNYDYIGYFDADLSTPLIEVNNFINKFQENDKLILVMGCRIQRSGANIIRDTYRHYFSRIFVTFINNYLSIKFYDTQAGAKLFRVSNVKTIFNKKFITNWLFDIEIILRIKKQKKQSIYELIYELPLESWVEKSGSKIKLIDIIKLPFLLRKIKKTYL